MPGINQRFSVYEIFPDVNCIIISGGRESRHAADEKTGKAFPDFCRFHRI